ncbi:DNA cytosine methyltransferase [Brevibacterium epidermidis]|uniref:DNA cytosine methyltransferase n=1 Tax=Brevibacterium epidermidis TaxID=1698 RepID=UPI002410E4ED|nr:DNA cytosine methyltransferase [Brevibacterium epidermidis]
MNDTPSTDDCSLKIGSLFSGYGGLDLAVEHATGGRTVWFSELNELGARVFTHHWPDAPNLGDITAVRWNDVEPVDVLCGEFPYQGRLDRRQRCWPRPRHPLRPLVVHGDRDRSTATRARGDRERPRAAVRTRNPSPETRNSR